MDLAAARSDRRGARRCWPRVRPVSGAVRGIRLAAQLLAGLRRDRGRLERLAAPRVGRCGPARSSRGGPTRPHPGRRRRRWSRGPPGRSRAARLASAHRSLRGRGRRRCAALPRDPGGPRPRRSIARRWTSRVGCATAWRRDPRSRSTARTTLRPRRRPHRERRGRGPAGCGRHPRRRLRDRGPRGRPLRADGPPGPRHDRPGARSASARASSRPPRTSIARSPPCAPSRTIGGASNGHRRSGRRGASSRKAGPAPQATRT